MNFKSKWICAAEFALLEPIDVYHKQFADVEVEKTPEELKNNHCMFRKTFEANGANKYTIDISADDYYKLYVNGTFVCQGPGGGYHDKYYYNTADITPYVNDGKNVIAVHVYYQGLINRVWNSGDNRQGMIADVYCNGEYAFGTDSSWLYGYAREYVSGGTIGYETQYIENIDFNLAVPDWNKVDFAADGYANAAEKENDDHVFVDCVPCVDVYTIKPQSAEKLDSGHWFVDFGKEYTGQIHFAAKGGKGEKVIVRCGEETDGAHSVRYDMRCNCKYEETCTLSGGSDEFLFYDYKAFRYAEIICDSDCVDNSSIDMIVRHHKFDETAYKFECNNKLLCNVWDICTQTLKIGTQEFYLDCPSREKGQYLGDFMVTGLAHMYVTGDWEMYRKALLEFAYSSKVCPGIMAVAPGAFMQEIADFSLIYPYEVLTYFKYTGDIDTVSQLMPYIDNLIKYFGMYKRPDGLLEGVHEKWNLVDWPQNLRDDYDFDLPSHTGDTGCHNVVNAYYYIALKTTEQLKDILGIAHDSCSEAVKQAYIREFYKPELGLFTDTKESMHTALHSNVLPAFAGMVPEQAQENVKKLIMDKGLCCGVWFSYFVLKALANMGAYDEEYRLIVNDSIHSWSNMIKEGATTCYEAWGREQKWNTSLCHPWACSPVVALVEDIMGIAPDSFAKGALQAQPHMPEGLTLDVTLPCKGGQINFKR